VQNREQGRQCIHKQDIEACSCNICCHGKAISITDSECVSVALVYQHNMHIDHTISSYLACRAVPYCSTLSPHMVFLKKVWNIKCMLIFSTTSVWNFLYSEKNWGRCNKCALGLHVSYYVNERGTTVEHSNNVLMFKFKVITVRLIHWKCCYMFRLLWSHHKAKSLRNIYRTGVTSKLCELMWDPMRLYIGCCVKLDLKNSEVLLKYEWCWVDCDADKSE
jgi:hypothetical protein